MSWRPSASEELAHPFGYDEFYNESWYFDGSALDGSLGVYLRHGFNPATNKIWWWAHLMREGEPLVVCTDHDVPLSQGGQSGLEFRTEGLWAELVCEEPHQLWSCSLESFGLRVDDPYNQERGEKVPFGFELQWSAKADPYGYDGLTRYEQTCWVSGDIMLGDEIIRVEFPGQRDHSWGERNWWTNEWRWVRAWFDDGSAYHGTEVPLGPEFSYVQGYEVDSSGNLTGTDKVSVKRTDDSSFDIEVGDTQVRAEVAIEGPAPMTGDDGRFAWLHRSVVRVEASDGRKGSGFLERSRDMGGGTPGGLGS